MQQYRKYLILGGCAPCDYVVCAFQAHFIAAIMTNGILIADDSEVFRKAVRCYLTLQQFEICGDAIDGTDVLEKASALEPALVILDLRMPNMNGVEVASVLKGRMPDVRILLLTMYDEVLEYKSLMAAIGIDAMMTKTDCFKTLAECVRGLLSSPRPRSAPNKQNQQAQGTGSQIL